MAANANMRWICLAPCRPFHLYPIVKIILVNAVRADEGKGLCHTPFLEECPQYNGHKRDSGVTPKTCGAINERAQVILVWMKALGRWEHLPPTGTRNHEG